MNACSLSSGEGVLALLGGLDLLLCANGHLVLLEGAQSSAESSVLLHAEVDGGVSLLLVRVTSAGDSLLTKNGQHLGDVLANLLDHGELNLGLGRNLADTESGQFSLKDNNQTKNEKLLTRCLVSSSTRAASSFCLSSCAFTLCILLNLIINNTKCPNKSIMASCNPSKADYWFT